MAGIEHLRSGTPKNESFDQREIRRDYHFRALIQSHLIDTFRDALDESGFDEKQSEEAAIALSSLSEKDAKSVLAIPFELRQRLFDKYHKEISAGSMTAAEMVRDIQEKNSRYGYNLGYHLSTHQIPKEQPKDGKQEWNIRGSELDDRDDMKMAYYSEDYLNRYKKKSGNSYLYIVRAEISPNSAHKQDLKNHWGRAPYLSIIDEFDMRNIENEIDAAMEKEDAATSKVTA